MGTVVLVKWTHVQRLLSVRAVTVGLATVVLAAVAVAAISAFSLYQSSLVRNTHINAEVTPLSAQAASVAKYREATLLSLYQYRQSPSTQNAQSLAQNVNLASQATAALARNANELFSDEVSIPQEEHLAGQVHYVVGSGADFEQALSTQERVPWQVTLAYARSISALSEDLTDALAGASQELEYLARQELGLIAVLASVAALGEIGLLIVLTGAVLRPLRSLSEQLRSATASPDTSHVHGEGLRELHQVAVDAEGMRAELVRRADRIRSTDQALQDEAPVVALLRSQLTTPAAPAWVDLVSVQAQGVLAGDWVDVQVREECTWVVLGDVSGHGPASAVMALRLREAMRGALVGQPHEALRVARECVLDQELGSFASVLVLRFCASEGGMRLSWANAGHPPALAWDGQLRELGTTGPVVSALPATWQTQDMTLPTGAMLMAYTDGVSELRLAGGDELGTAWLVSQLELAYKDPGTSAVDIMDRLRVMGSRHWGRDDATLLLARMD